MAADQPQQNTPAFVLGMFSISGSPAFPAMVFDDDAAVPLVALLPLAARLGRPLIGAESLDGLLQYWDSNFATLCALARALADDRAGRGSRGSFTSVEFLAPTLPLLPRQVFELPPAGPGRGALRLRPITTVAGAQEKVLLQPGGAGPRCGLALGAVFGRAGWHVPSEQAPSCLAGYLTAAPLEFEAGEDGIGGNLYPGSLPLGPYLVPAAFAPPLGSLAVQLAVNGAAVPHGAVADPTGSLAGGIAALTARCRVLPGDLLYIPLVPSEAGPVLGDGDVVEASIAGLGQLGINIVGGP